MGILFRGDEGSQIVKDTHSSALNIRQRGLRPVLTPVDLSDVFIKRDRQLVQIGDSFMGTFKPVVIIGELLPLKSDASSSQRSRLTTM